MCKRFFIFTFVFLSISCCTISSKDNSSPMTKEYFMRITQNEEFFIWKIKKEAQTENGFKSLQLKDEGTGKGIVFLTEPFLKKIEWAFNDEIYQVEGDSFCGNINGVFWKLKNQFEEHLICIKATKSSELFVFLIGANEQEILKEIKADKENNEYWHPSWYDYEVKQK